MISVDPLKENNILYLKVLAEEIDFNPAYQRESDIWPLSKKQLFIDSLINGIDVPKLYFHEIKKTAGSPYRYAVVDGKQRLETIFAFLDDGFKLADDFTDFSGEHPDLRGKTYSEFSQVSLKFKASFDAKQLPIHIIRTDDEDLIEEMFYRLNEAAPLNAPEKRNSFKGPFPQIVRDLAEHPFFRAKVLFSSKRYKHHEAIAKILIILYAGRVSDTKRIHLDNFARSMVSMSRVTVASLEDKVKSVLNEWSSLFADKDPLLRSPSVLPVYLMVYTEMKQGNTLNLFRRSELESFEAARKRNRLLARDDEQSQELNYSWLEYDRLVQSPNDSSSIEFRASVLQDFLINGERAQSVSPEFLNRNPDVIRGEERRNVIIVSVAIVSHPHRKMNHA